ncbi:hypothetical protein C7375_1383 [Frischella perrara]|uniref:Uncharacterized protein n=1 Tax=Frischella perrara TaxID=1267021 RepID=A0A0A7S3Z0_FRIPE|nr:hypothetical protein [Frischella perrara]AJA45552.1 hypothetical protein FPB0191_01736 [Frischella perrara]PWV57670.1 hypothetical protein C7375_1383 [Frischella perrara]
MVKITRDEVILDIAKVIGPLFEQKGFVQKKNIFEFHDSNTNNIYQYEILLSKRKGYFSLHLRLKLLNKPFMKEVNKVAKKVWLDEDFIRLDGRSDEMIKYAMKIRLSDYNLGMVTDWRNFKEEKEPLSDFNDRFSIWFSVFDDINEIPNWKAQLVQSVLFTEKWVSDIQSNPEQWIIDHTIYQALYLLKKQNRIIELNEKYNYSLTLYKSNNELIFFYKYLTAS